MFFLSIIHLYKSNTLFSIDEIPDLSMLIIRVVNYINNLPTKSENSISIYFETIMLIYLLKNLNFKQGESNLIQMLVNHCIEQLIFLKLKDREDITEKKQQGNRNKDKKAKNSKTKKIDNELVGHKNYQKDKIEDIIEMHDTQKTGNPTEEQTDKYFDACIHDADLSDDEFSDIIENDIVNDFDLSDDENDISYNEENSEDFIETSDKHSKLAKRLNRIDIEYWLLRCPSLKKVLDELDEFEFFDNFLKCLQQNNNELYDMIFSTLPKTKLKLFNKIKGSRKVKIEGETKIRKIRKIKTG